MLILLAAIKTCAHQRLPKRQYFGLDTVDFSSIQNRCVTSGRSFSDTKLGNVQQGSSAPGLRDWISKRTVPSPFLQRWCFALEIVDLNYYIIAMQVTEQKLLRAWFSCRFATDIVCGDIATGIVCGDNDEV